MKRDLADGTTLDIDRHHLRRDGPVLHIAVRGNLTVANMQALVDVYQALLDEQGFLLLLMDVHGSTGMDMAARKVATAWSTKYADVLFSAVVGAGSFMQTMMNLFNRAIRVMSSTAPGLLFCATEDEGRAWLLARLEALRAAS